MQAIIFGAGNIGRGFIGQLFSRSGYQVTFVDVDQTLVAALNRQRYYTIRLVTNASTTEVKVGPVSGLVAHDREAVIRAMAQADIGATAVGAAQLGQIAPNVAAGIARRAAEDLEKPLNLLVCENLKGAANSFRALVKAELSGQDQTYLAGRVGFVDTVIARMVPPLTPALRQQDPSFIIAEPYDELPVDAAGFVGPPPDIAGLKPVSPFSFYTERKLYLHNAGHAVLGYLGYSQGYTYGYEALSDAHIAAVVQGAMAEAQQALELKYGLPVGELTAYVADLLVRFSNQALADTVFRLGRDPIRKLAPHDRLVGAALLALSQGIQPVHLASAIVAALGFDHPADPIAVDLQARLQRDGLEAVLQEVCGLELESPLAGLIRSGTGSIAR